MNIAALRTPIAGLMALAVLAFAAPALAAPASFTVQTTADGNQATPGSTSCATATDSSTAGKCTLRSAIEAADSEPTGTDVTITVPAGTYKLTVANSVCSKCSPLPSGSYALDLGPAANSIDISGAGASTTIVDANFLDRAFDISSGPTVTISGMTIEHGRPGGNGNVSTCPTSNDDSNVASGGGILDTTALLTLSDDVLTDNLTVGDGGAVENNGPGELKVSGSTFTGNIACTPTFVPPFGNGGAIDESDAGSVVINSSTITHNTAGLDGGGVDEAGGATTQTPGTLSVTSSTISDNSAPNGDGGGIAGEGPSFTSFAKRPGSNAAQKATLPTGITLYRDLLTGNQASSGGGVAGYDQTRIVDTTVTGNSASGQNVGGGGLAVFGSWTVSFSTIAGNSATSGAGNIDGSSDAGGALTIDDTIVAGDAASNCTDQIFYTDNGNNLFYDPADTGPQCGYQPGKNDQLGVNPKLGALAANGGPTETLALLGGSPAIDAGSDALCTETKNAAGTEIDQRFITRPQGQHCDIGAFEATPDVGVTGSVSKDPIFVGQQDTVTWVVGNSNPTDAEDTTFTDPAAGYTIDSVTPSQGTCTHTATSVSCHLGLVPPGGHVTITVVVTGTTKGRITLNGRTATTGTDLNKANNHATVRITVKRKSTPPPPPPPPPKPPRPTITMIHLGAGCHAEGSSFNIVSHAAAKGGIHTFTVEIGKHVAGSFRTSGKSTKHRTLVVHVKGALYVAGRTYTVVGQVVDSLGRSARVERHFTLCKPRSTRGFTG